MSEGRGGDAPAPARGTTPGQVILDAFETWRAWPLRLHLLTILALTLAAVGRWWELLTFSGPQIDERIYLEAARYVLDGQSPFEHPVFFYPPPFAFLLGALLELLGEPGVLAVLRTLNLLGLGVVIWVSMAWVPLRWAWRLFAGLAAIGLVFGVQLGLMVGNLSFAIGATIVGALLLWKRWPILSGFFLGVGTALKPLAAVVILLLLVHRPAQPGRQGIWAGGVAAAVAGGLLLAFPHLSDFLELGRHGGVPFDRYPFQRTLSLSRWLSALGVPVGAAASAVLVALAAALLGRLRSWGRFELLCLSLAAMTLASPALWAHSLVITLPIQAAALSLAAAASGREDRGRVREGAEPGTRPLLGGHLEIVLVLLAVVAIQVCDRIGGVSTLPPLQQVLLLIPPTFAPAALAAYVIRQVTTRT